MRLRMLFILLAMLMLVACGNSEEDDEAVDNALNFLQAINAGDIERARELSCEDRHAELEQGLMSQDREAFNFSNISCEGDADSVTCDYTIVQDEVGPEADPAQDTQQFVSIIFDMEDGKVCGFEEEVATQ